MRYIFIVLILFCTCANDAFAVRKRARDVNYDITRNAKYAAIVVNATNGSVLLKQNENEIRHPASLTKMMTIYLTLQAIESRKLALNKEVKISSNAASKPRTNLNLKAGQTITVRDALYGMIIHSANDASVAMAEAISGSEEEFANLMNKTAAQLGMDNTNFVNAHGLHHPKQVSTAADLAKLAIAIRRDYGKYYDLFSKKSFIFRGSVITGHNRVLNRYKWADGLKTGFINASGFNLATSASRPEGKLVAVVLGGHSARARDDHMIALLETGFSKMTGKRTQHIEVAQKQEPEPKIEMAAVSTVNAFEAVNKLEDIDNFEHTELAYNDEMDRPLSELNHAPVMKLTNAIVQQPSNQQVITKREPQKLVLLKKEQPKQIKKRTPIKKKETKKKAKITKKRPVTKKKRQQ